LRFQQVVINLLTNSIKFSHYGGKVIVKVKSKAAQDDTGLIDLSVSVKDHGIGIAVKDQTTLFKPFNKTSDSKSQSLNQESHGLGLSICREIAKGLNGSISFISQLNQGSEFKFKLQVK